MARRIRSGGAKESWRQLLDRLRAPRSLWVAPALGATLAVCGVTLIQAIVSPTQVATARIALDPVAAGAAGAAQEWIATQVALLRSDRVAQRVLAEVGSGALGDVNDFDTRGASAHLLSHLRVETAGQGGLVSIGYRSPDAALSARIANAFVAAYDRVSQELRTSMEAAAAEMARDRISALRNEVDRAHARLQAAQDITNLRAGGPALVEGARIAGLAARVSWSGLADEQSPADQRSGLATQAPAAVIPPVGTLAAGEAQVQGMQAQDEYEVAQQALAAARTRFGELTGEQVLTHPAMTLVDAAAATSGQDSQRSGLFVWVAAIAGVTVGLLLRPAAQWIDPRVHSSERLASQLGVPVFGALVNVERAARKKTSRRSASARATGLPVAVPVLQ